MGEEEIVKELRTIRALLAIDKQDEMEELIPELSEVQKQILKKLSFSEWRPLSTSEIAEATETGTSTVDRHRAELMEKDLITSQGNGTGTEYQKTGLLRAAEQIGVLEK